ncbi:hypothetical protein BECAL_02302 [Bellilinea caldifistulae]|nr:hypothetical protein BECAL_02302 [Bellilinea caldifistulae]
MRLTTVQYLLLSRIYSTGGVRSLRRLCTDLNVDYSNAHEQIKRLSACGLISVQRANRELVIYPKLKPMQRMARKPRRAPTPAIQAKIRWQMRNRSAKTAER